jgi:hypothetical protein
VSRITDLTLSRNELEGTDLMREMGGPLHRTCLYFLIIICRRALDSLEVEQLSECYDPVSFVADLTLIRIMEGADQMEEAESPSA